MLNLFFFPYRAIRILAGVGRCDKVVYAETALFIWDQIDFWGTAINTILAPRLISFLFIGGDPLFGLPLDSFLLLRSFFLYLPCSVSLAAPLR